MTRLTTTARRPLRGSDYLLLLLVCAALYGVAAVSGRPLSVHEARVPELAREMADGQGDWLLPQSGGRPWLERPPLPHWLTAASMTLFRRNDSLWVVRLPAALAGCAVVLIGAWMAARWFGRNFGMLAGVVIATSYELYQYATLAEDDIYLGALVAACVAMFIRSEWPRHGASPLPKIAARDARGRAATWVRGFVSPRRDLGTVGFFVLLGLTNLAKGPLVGAVPVVATVLVYAALSRGSEVARRYTWLWGWLVFLALTAAWPWWAMRHYPDVWDNWRFDYLGQSEGGGATKWDESFWYYFMMLPLALAPWTWATVIGLLTSARRALRARRSPERFLWAWAFTGLIVLSLPARKHHHYLVPVLIPWAILSAVGLRSVARRLGRRGAVTAAAPCSRRRLDPRWCLGAALAVYAVCAAWLQFKVVGRDEATVAELQLLRDVDAAVPPGEPVLVNADVGSLGFFRLQFELGRWQRLVHNLSYLRDDDLTTPVAYVITRAKDEPELRHLGETRILAQANTARRDRPAGQRSTLFRLTFCPDLRRCPRPASIGVMQAMGRKPGPWCGEDWPLACRPGSPERHATPPGVATETREDYTPAGPDSPSIAAASRPTPRARPGRP